METFMQLVLQVIFMSQVIFRKMLSKEKASMSLQKFTCCVLVGTLLR